jgi:hypothetical protein
VVIARKRVEALVGRAVDVHAPSITQGLPGV